MRSKPALRLALATLVAVSASTACASPAAAVDNVTLGGVASAASVPRGATVTDTFTITNNSVGCSFCDEVYGLDMLLTRSKSDAPVPNPFVSVSTSFGSCTGDQVESHGYHFADCTFGPRSAMPATIQVVATITANESFGNFAGLTVNGESASVVADPVTRVIYPPSVSGSKKIALKGLPKGCAADDLTLKARAKGEIGRFTATIAGPRDEWGANYPDTFGKTIARASGKSRLKAHVNVSALTSGGFYQLTFQAVSKGHPTLSKKVGLQIC